MADCICEHSAEQHWRDSGHCLALLPDNTPCNCTKYSPYTKAQLSVLMAEDGTARILVLLADVRVQFHPDGLVELALAMLSTAYHARGQEALAKYAKEHNIPLRELLA